MAKRNNDYDSVFKAPYSNGDISSNELLELSSYVNTIITHITNGNKVERKVTEIMGNGVLLESPVNKIKQSVWAEADKIIAAKDREYETILTAMGRELSAKDREYEAKISAKDREYEAKYQPKTGSTNLYSRQKTRSTMFL